ncbi:hypothetical protein [Gloeobacter kilaueensis]|uniref:Uncharacterized protein n=1 Tax=Gloeobacter kilaueensis (strain ATCC BAA-2537 / CCAP 1431/1 / ULC 316 / JS1) TaxID=1183438 RepID=U5QDI8_GLOK1|nr:hypothetical protein [Gloeobacter kilaueensis]AGY56997.1 hypothetical protein GKIL_0751 [Gloeobacter kilaueensis JS1]
MPKATGEKKKGKTGRPKKFGRPSKSFYLVLPDDVVMRLRLIDPDMATAIVKTVENLEVAQPPDLVEVQTLSEHLAVLWVGEIAPLHNWPGIFLHKVEPGRYLLVLDRHYDLARFELDVRDWLEASRSVGAEAAAFEKLAATLRQLRQQSQALHGAISV